jgi:hypothetical protein
VPSTASAGIYVVTVEFDSGTLAGVIAQRSDVPLKTSVAPSP